MTLTPHPLELLEQKVTPLVVDQNQLPIDIDKKSSLLKQFYPIMLTAFHEFPERLESIMTNTQEPLRQLFGHHHANLDELLQAFSVHHSVQPETATALFNQAIPLSINTLKEAAGGQGIAAYLAPYLEQIRSSILAWALALLAGLGLGHFAKPSVSSNVTPVVAEEPASGFKKILPWIALLILALLVLFFWRSCQKQPSAPHNMATTATSEPAANVAASPASLSLTSGTGEQVLGCQAYAGNTSLSDAIRSAITHVFGATTPCNLTTDMRYATQLPAQDKLETLLGLVKSVPNASIEWVGNQITVNAPNTTALGSLIEKMKAAAPELTILAAKPLNVTESVNNSINASTAALDQLGENANVTDIVHALNLQIINFASGSAAIPDQNKAILDRAAILLEKVPNLALNVEGYTDSTGSAALNKTLSQQRAQAVVDYLASKGIQTSNLKAVGYGAEHPVADNETEQGKFRNRRIAFTVSE